MTYKVGPKGQVVIPKDLRDTLGIRPGDDVLVELRYGGALVRRVPRDSTLYGMLADEPVDLIAELEADRREERRREERKLGQWPR